ncbi:S-layer homology domain-containing protein [Candidatus Gracilibacteria bacterium]|nr:S-layer homology domain-containing protein [Candidatus Gracilibacteria bacterium]
MKKYFSSLLIGVFAFVLFSQSVFASFYDVKDSAQTKAIDWFQRMVILDGYNDGTFRPDNDVTRAEFLKIFYETQGPEDVEIELPFKDIEKSAWYIKYLKQAYKNNVIKGYDDGTFRPNDPISVAEASKIVGDGFFDVEALFGSAKSLYKCSEKNVPRYVEWYGKYFSVLDSMCLISSDGFEENVFLPNAKMTRGGVAVLVYKAKVSSDNGNKKYSDNLVPKYLPEKGAFIVASGEAICLIYQTENVEDIFGAEFEKEVKAIYEKYGFDSDDEAAFDILDSKYGQDPDVKFAMEIEVARCSKDFLQ